MNSQMRVVIGIATAGRREQLKLTLEQLAHQRRPADRILVCPARPEDVDDAHARDLGLPIEVVSGSPGLCAQRNAILRECVDQDVLVFFDDDFYPASDYIERAIELFLARPTIVMATNHPQLDGANGRGINHEEALDAVREYERGEPPEEHLQDTYAGYGCNMVIRLGPVRANRIWFDENLPLYSWLEDVDFSRRLSESGRIVACNRLRGVHLGTKRGRTSGVRLGYSQIANPLYMMQKGTLSTSYALRQMGRNVAKNTLLLCWPEPWVDRRGRFKGNTIALRHLVAGRLHPMNALELE